MNRANGLNGWVGHKLPLRFNIFDQWRLAVQAVMHLHQMTELWF